MTWRTTETHRFMTPNGEQVTVTREVGPLDHRGYHYPNGKERVRATYEDGRPYQGRSYRGRAQTFKGETAWMNAERLIHDLRFEVQIGR